MGLFDFLFGKPKSYEQTREDLPLLANPKRALNERSAILDLKVGDVVSYNGTDFIVRNRHAYESHGFEWFSYQLVDSISGQKFWLDAEDDDAFEVALSHPAELPLSLPLPNQLQYQGRHYRLDEHGYAKVLIESEDSTPRYSQVEYWDYEDAQSERYLGIERWGDELEASLSESIEPYELTVLGGSNA